MTRRVLGLGVAVSIWLVMAAAAGAQQGTAEVRGRVADTQGAEMPGVTVTIKNQDSGQFRVTVSGDAGAFIAPGLLPGRYEIVATLQGFKTFSRRDLQLEVGRTTTIDVTMEVGGMEEVVNVTASTPLVDVSSKEIGGNITSDTLVQMPSVNGNFIGFLGLLPGIVPSISTESFGSDSISVNGQDSRNNNYMVDGGGNNDDVIGQRAGMQARTPIEAVQEFQVLTGQYDAEFGRTTGAVVNAVIKSGSNVTHGSAFGFFQDSSLTAKDALAKARGLAKADTSYQRWGGVIGGPVLVDRMHYFASLERFSIDRANTLAFPTRPDLNDQQTTRDRVWNTIVRGDHQLSPRHTYNVRWLREQSPQANQIVPTAAGVYPTGRAAREETDVDQTLAFSMNSVLSNTKVNTVRLAWTRENVTFGNACYTANGRDLGPCDPTLAYQNFTDQQDNTGQYRINDGMSFDDTLAWFLPGKKGDHDIKVGVQYAYSGAINVNHGNLNGTFTFAQNDVDFDPANARTYPDRFSIRVGGPSRFYQKATYFSLFGQDKWRVTPRLTLSVGLRYDLEIIPLAETDNPLIDGYPVDKNNIQPRLGVVYDLGGGKSVIRGGYGRFFEKTHFELIGGLYTGTPFTNSLTVNFPTSAADAGPRNGRLPTDPFLVNGPVVNRALLDAQYPPGRLLRNTGANWDNPDRVVPYSDEITLGYERQLASNLAVSADYVHVVSRDLLMQRDLNAGIRATTVSTSTLTRQPSAALADAYVALRTTYPGFGNFTTGVTQPVNVGELDYDALLLSVNKRFGSNYEARVSYTLSKTRGNTSGNGVAAASFQVLEDLLLDRNEGPSNFDLRHNFVVSGRAVIPKTGGLNVSWVARALSGTPFTLVDNTIDADRNGVLFDPLAAGSYAGTPQNGFTAYSVDFNGKRNGAYGPGFVNLDARISYAVRLGPRRLEIVGDVFNLTDRANFANPTADASNAGTFLLLRAYSTSYAPRKLQLGARFVF